MLRVKSTKKKEIKTNSGIHIVILRNTSGLFSLCGNVRHLLIFTWALGGFIYRTLSKQWTANFIVPGNQWLLITLGLKLSAPGCTIPVHRLNVYSNMLEYARLSKKKTTHPVLTF